MNYQHHYNTLCERARNRHLDCYTETHHIIPRCMGGTDDPENLVALTPEEHYVAHQLLVKMYPDHKGLVWAALKMTGHTNDQRANNKIYGWLRRKQRKIASHLGKQRIGKKNGSYGRFWYHNPKTKENIKCLPEEVPDGYVKGQFKKEKPNSKCQICGIDTGTKRSKYCKKHRRMVKAKNILTNKEILTAGRTGKFYVTNGEKDKLIKLGTPIPKGYYKGRTNGLRTKAG